MADEVSRTNPTHGLGLQAEIRQLRRDLLDLGNEQEVRSGRQLIVVSFVAKCDARRDIPCSMLRSGVFSSVGVLFFSTLYDARFCRF